MRLFPLLLGFAAICISLVFLDYLPTAWGLATLILILLWIIYGVASIQSGMFLKAHCSGRTNRKMVSLTFDDGPDPENTERVLEVLNKHHAKAMFFLIGSKVLEYPELVKKIISQGHTIGNHSFHHSFFFTFSPTKKVKKEIEDTNAAIQSVTGRVPEWFRPPFGITNPNIAKAARKCNMRVMGWNVRSLDTRGKSPETVLKRVISGTKPGAVVLFHDRVPNTAQTVELYLQYLAQNGYEIVQAEMQFAP